MVKESNNQEQPLAPGVDKLAMETAHEIADEALSRFGKIMTTSLSEEEKEKEIENLLKELNARGNEIYLKKLENTK